MPPPAFTKPEEPLPEEVRAVLQRFAALTPCELAVEQGDREAPARWARSIFGEETACSLSDTRAGGPVRAGSKAVSLEVDVFVPVKGAVDLLQRAAAAGVRWNVVRTRVVRVDPRSPESEHARLVLEIRLALSHPLEPAPVVKAVRVARGEVPDADRLVCGACGAVHRLRSGNKPYPGAERDRWKEPCRKCDVGTLEVFVYGEYELEFLDEVEPEVMR